MEIIVPILIIFATSLLIAAGPRPIIAVAIGADYVLVGLLFWSGVKSSVSLAFIIAGLTIGAITWLAGDRVLPWPKTAKNKAAGSQTHADPGGTSAASPPLGWLFMGMVLILCIVVSFGLSSTYPLAGVVFASPWESFVVYWLLIVGALASAVTRNPLRSGSGLLLLLCGTAATHILVAEGSRSAVVMGLLLTGVLVAIVINHLSLERLKLDAVPLDEVPESKVD